MTDWQNFFDQPIRHNLIIYYNIQKIATGQGDDYKTVFLIDYNYFKNYCKMTAIDLSKQEALDADQKAIQPINFTGNIENQSAILFIIEEDKKSFRFFTRNCKSILILFFALM